MNLSNSDFAARYDVTNVDGTIDYNPLESHTRGTALPDFSSKIKVSPLGLFTRALKPEIGRLKLLSYNCNILTWGIKKKLLRITHFKLCITPPASSTKSSPHKNIPLTVAQHFPERRGTLSCMYKNILLTAAQDFMAQYRLFCKHTTHKNTIELFSNIETCFTIFLPFVVHSLIIIFYKSLNFVYFPVI